MSPNETPVAQRVRDAMRDAQRNVQRHRVRLAMRRGAIQSLAWFQVAAMWTFALTLPIGLATGWQPFAAWPWLALLTVGIGLLPFVLTIGDALARTPSLREVVERVDRGEHTYNAIATALEFAQAENPPVSERAFRSAAIEHGLRELERLKSPRAWGEARERWPRGWRYALLLATLLTIALPFLPAWVRESGEVARRDEPFAFDVASARNTSQAGDTEEVTRTDRPDRPREETPDERSRDLTDQQASGASPSSSRLETTERQPAQGKPGKGRAMAAKQARQASRSQGDPTAGESAKPLADDQPKKPKKPRKKPDEARVVGKKKTEEQKTGATAGQAGSGGGAMSPVASPWDQRDRTSDDPLPENPAEEDVEDEIEQEEARGGTQPTMKDRRGATSRDLSISGPGEGGDGRGGPTPPKKARGTASLVLGVPVPDFVRGQLNPGTTKVTHERTDPVPAPGDPSAIVDVPARFVREPIVQPAWVAPEWRSTLSRFFVELRRHEEPRGSSEPSR